MTDSNLLGAGDRKKADRRNRAGFGHDRRSTTLALMASEYSAPQSYRWTIGLLLALGVLVNYFDRVNLSVSHDALVSSFHITPTVFGQLSAAYSWTYAACQLPTGVLLDNFGVRKVSLVSIFIWGDRLDRRGICAECVAVLRGAAVARYRRSAHLSGECKGCGRVVPSARALVCNRHVRQHSEAGERRSACLAGTAVAADSDGAGPSVLRHCCRLPILRCLHWCIANHTVSLSATLSVVTADQANSNSCLRLPFPWAVCCASARCWERRSAPAHTTTCFTCY